MLVLIKIVLIAVIGNYLMSSCNSNAANENHNRNISKSKQSIQKNNVHHIFAKDVLSSEDGKTFYHKGFGLVKHEQNILNTTNTKLYVGSVNNTHSKIVVMQFIGYGRFKPWCKIGT